MMRLITWWFFKLVGKGDILPIWPVLYSKIPLHPFSTSHGKFCLCHPFFSHILYCYPHSQPGREVTHGHWLPGKDWDLVILHSDTIPSSCCLWEDCFSLEELY